MEPGKADHRDEYPMFITNSADMPAATRGGAEILMGFEGQTFYSPIYVTYNI